SVFSKFLVPVYIKDRLSALVSIAIYLSICTYPPSTSFHTSGSLKIVESPQVVCARAPAADAKAIQSFLSRPFSHPCKRPLQNPSPAPILSNILYTKLFEYAKVPSYRNPRCACCPSSRSEERRVGKECSYQVSKQHQEYSSEEA